MTPAASRSARGLASPSRSTAAQIGDTTEQQVRRAAVALFAGRGFHATGIRELAHAAGVRSSTLYHYMGTKEDLLFAIIQDSSRRLIDAAHRLADLDLAPDAMVCALVAMHVSVHATYRDETAVVDKELRCLDDDRRARAVELRDAYEVFWTRAVSAGVRDGVFSVHNQRLARLGILQMCSGVAGWYSPKGPLALAELGQAHAHMALQLLGHRCGIPTVAKILRSIDVQAVVDDVWSAAGTRRPVVAAAERTSS